MPDHVIGICDWCRESYVIRYGCECKKLASNQEWLEKAGLMVKPISCGICGDIGNTQEAKGFIVTIIECQCTKDPRSLYSFIKKCKE